MVCRKEISDDKRAGDGLREVTQEEVLAGGGSWRTCVLPGIFFSVRNQGSFIA